MIPNWRRIGKLVGDAVKFRRWQADKADRDGTIESLKRVAAVRPHDFWKEVELRLAIERRVGIYEGADAAKRIIRKELDACKNP